MELYEEALLRACEESYTEIVKELLAYPKIDPNIKDDYGQTPLLSACNYGRTEIVKALLAHPNIDVNFQNRYGTTPLLCACWDGSTEIVKELLACPKIDPNIQNKYGQTPLLNACNYGRTEIVKALLAHPKIDPTIKDRDGKKPLEIARENGHTEIETLLEDFIKKNEQQATEEFCLAMIQPDLPVVSSRMTRKRKAKELRRDELRLGSELIKSIAMYLEWKDISNKSCFEVMKKKKKKN